MLSDTAIWVPNGLSQVGLVRVRSDSGFSGNPVMVLGGMLVHPRWQPQPCWYCQLRAGTLANRSLFEGAELGDRPPAW